MVFVRKAQPANDPILFSLSQSILGEIHKKQIKLTIYLC